MRILTLVIEADQPTANWIWESHLKNKMINGVTVDAIGSGNQLKRMEKEEIIRKIFNELMHQEVGHDWGLLDKYANDPLSSATDFHYNFRIASIGGDWNAKKEEVLQKAIKIADCLVKD